MLNDAFSYHGTMGNSKLLQGVRPSPYSELQVSRNPSRTFSRYLTYFPNCMEYDRGSTGPTYFDDHVPLESS